MNLLDNIPDFSSSKILVIGDVMIDKYWYGGSDRISPEAPVPVVKVDKKENRLGGAANVAINLSSLGCDVSLMGLVGNDEGNIFIEKELNRNKIKNKLFIKNQIPTTTKLRIISKNFQLIRLDFETSQEQCVKKDQDEIIKNFRLIIEEFDLVIFSDYNKGFLSIINKLIDISNKFNIKTLVDPKQKDELLYKNAFLLKPNINEFELMVGSCKSEEDFDKKAFQLLDHLQLEALVITRGADGISLFQKGRKIFKQKSSSREVYDVTGAGDTVIAILGAFLSQNFDLEKAVHFANAAAGIVIGKVGTSFITSNDLITINNKSDIFLNKLYKEEDLIAEVRNHHFKSQKIVITNGCFDILHAGHIDYLKEAKNLGDKLIIAVNSDASIRKLKGKNRPINIFENRVKVLSSLSFVDYIIGFEENTPEELIKKIKPDILVKGSDYEINNIAGAEFVISNGGQVKTIKLTEGLSSSFILNKLEEF